MTSGDDCWVRLHDVASGKEIVIFICASETFVDVALMASAEGLLVCLSTTCI